MQLVHTPSGITVRSESERSQKRNKDAALQELRARLIAAQRDDARKQRHAARKQQVGTGARGEKRRTIAVQRGNVIDHERGRSLRFRDYERGRLEPLVE